MLHVIIPDFDPYPEDAPFCHFCDIKIGEGESILLRSDTAHYSSVTPLHRNCVVAYATRILNEFEKL